MFRRLYLLMLIVSPGIAEAAVSIHEVAWMGDTTSANHEWIELYNSGDAAVSLEGWTLTDGINLTITLTGTVSSGEYAVLERTSEESALGTAFLIYTGALVNTGATLVLRDGTGTILDQVPGGEEWQNIGGDNTTKDTAQYTPSGWITAPGTPGRANATVASEAPPDSPTQENDNETSTPSTGTKAGSVSRSGSTPVVLKRGDSSLKTTITAPAQVYVNQPVTFTLTTAGAGPSISASLKHSWNFGDTETASGTSATHAFAYPGTYLVTARSVFAKNDVMARHKVTVLPVKVTLGRTESLDILLQNESPYEVDISGYRIVGEHELVMPPGTIILERGTITLPRHRVESGQVESLVFLYDGARQPLTSTYAHGAVAMAEEIPLPLALPEERVVTPAYRPPVALLPVTVSPPTSSLAAAVVSSVEAAERPDIPVPPDERQTNTERWPYVMLLILIGGALLAIFRQPSVALDRDSTTS